MANKDDPSSTNKSQLRVVDDGQIQSVAKSLRESTNGMIIDSFWLIHYMPFTWNLNVPHFISMFSWI